MPTGDTEGGEEEGEGGLVVRGFTYWLRWLLVLPWAVLAGLLATFPLHWILYASLSSWINPYPKWPEQVLTPLACAYGFIKWGSGMAPEKRITTARVLAGVWAAVLLYMIGSILTGSPFLGQRLYFQSGGLPVLASIAGAFLALRQTSSAHAGDREILRKMQAEEARLQQERERLGQPDRDRDE